jgi:hypothetical protein
LLQNRNNMKSPIEAARLSRQAADFSSSVAGGFPRKKNLIVTYVCLVGFPLLALIGILDIGHDLRAPIAVGGIWNVEADLVPLAAGPCMGSLAESHRPVLSISQSGEFLALTLDRMEGSGSLADGAVTAALSQSPTDSSCSAQKDAVYLHANLERSSGDEVMTGTIGANRCPACAAISFRAILQHASARVGR